MTTRRGAPNRVLPRFFVLAVAFCALYAMLGGSVSAAAPPMTAEALPATGLGDQVITVAWQGFAPTRSDGTDSVVIMQCRAHPRSVNNDCNTANTFPYDLNGNQQAGTTSKDGTGSVFIDIMTTARLPSLACSQSTPCSLLVYETTANGFDANGLPPANTRVIVPLSFARNSADCPPVQAYAFKVEAEASAAPALYQWAAALCTGQHAFAIDVTNTSSNQARKDYLTNLVDIGVTSVPPEAGEITPTAPKFAVAPLDLTGIVIAYNITDPVTHKQITDLTLTPRLVSRLLSDSDIESFFSDPELLKLNPHDHWPIQAADPGLRGEQNADTWLVTNWVNANPAARAFLDGKDRYGVPVNPSWLNVPYPTDVFAARNSNGVYFPRIGEEGVAQRLFAATKPADSVPTASLDAGEIGILDYPTALRFKLPIANLTNGVGQPVVAANPFSIAAGYAAMQTSAAGFHVEPPVVSGANVYPLAKVDQAMVPPKLTTSPKDLRMRAFLDYAVGPGQMNMPPGYVPLPSPLAQQTAHYTGDPLATTTPTTPTTTSSLASALSPLANNVSPLNTGGGYGGTATATIPATTPATSGPKHATIAPAATTPTSNGARFVALRLSSSGDHLVFPIVVGIGLLAVGAAGVDGVRRHGRTLWRWVRRRPPPVGGQTVS